MQYIFTPSLITINAMPLLTKGMEVKFCTEEIKMKIRQKKIDKDLVDILNYSVPKYCECMLDKRLGLADLKGDGIEEATEDCLVKITLDFLNEIN